MRFHGAKARCGELARVIQSLIPDGGVYWEPFVGSGKVMARVRCHHRFGSDIDTPIISLLQAVRDGWKPPSKVTRDDWQYWKEMAGLKQQNPMVAFCGYGCSFGGMFFHSYIEESSNRGINPAVECRRSLLRQRPFLQNVLLRGGDYRQTNPLNLLVRGSLTVYADPPYDGTTACGSRPDVKFDSLAFWTWAVAVASLPKVAMLVSEYSCPVPGAVTVWEKSVQVSQGNNHAKSAKRIKEKKEKLFLLNPDAAKRVGLGLIGSTNREK